MATAVIVAVRRYYYWIVAQEGGTPYLIFGGNDEEGARRKGLEILGGLDFEIKRFPTRNLAQASSFYRGKRLDDTHSLRDSSKRIGHDRSLARLKRRKQRGLE